MIPLKKDQLKWGLFAICGLAILLIMGFAFWPSQETKIDFNTEIRPILNKSCLSCHGGVKRNGDLSLLFREEALVPAKSGKAAIVPYHPEQSELIHRIRHPDPEERMPLDADPLSQHEIDLLNSWIEQGANWETHWAYIPPDTTIKPPKVRSSWIKNDIDRFVLQKLESHNLSPSKEASKSILLRRVSFDLIGLPPTLQELESFLQDDSPGAYEKAVDRLLASPHFGEHWASMWMDLARYGDSQGYQKDPARNIWRWRDWVIHAFNQDMPFDQFTIEQLAGDLLPQPSEQQLLATAFHRNTMSNDEGGTDDEEFRVTAVIDRVNTTFEIWQGTTMGCVQCHSHPYDPYKHEEFYQLYAFFNNTADADRSDEFPTKTLFSPAQTREIQSITNWFAKYESPSNASIDPSILAQREFILNQSPLYLAASCDPTSIASIRTGDGFQYVRRFSEGSYLHFPQTDLGGIDSVSIQYLGGNETASIQIFRGSPQGTLLGEISVPPTKGWYGQAALQWEEVGSAIPTQDGIYDLYLVARNQGKGAICDLFSFYLHRDAKSFDEQDRIRQQNYQTLAEIGPGKTPIMQELDGQDNRVTRLFERGNWLVHGDTIYPDVPAILNSFPSSYSSDRLGLAQWLVHPENPLTSRVIVNRFWEQIFGIGLVETLEDFGTQGEKPSHPELLDWLAIQFRDQHSWKVKSLLRQIVMSASYRQSSTVTPDLLERDPANRLLARGPRVRLSAEQIRDQALAVSGLLDRTIYGPSVMPTQPEGVWQVIRNVMKWIPSDGSDRYRRTLYTYWRRSSPYPAMMTFDAPSREFCVSRRVRTNTPLPALTTLNDSTYIEAAQALAMRMTQEAGDNLQQQLAYAYLLTVLESPSSGETGST